MEKKVLFIGFDFFGGEMVNFLWEVVKWLNGVVEGFVFIVFE